MEEDSPKPNITVCPDSLSSSMKKKPKYLSNVHTIILSEFEHYMIVIYISCESFLKLKLFIFQIAVEGNIGSGKTTLLNFFRDNPLVEVSIFSIYFFHSHTCT